MNKQDIEQLKNVVRKGSVLVDEPLAAYTSFKTGGPADVLVIPAGPEELAATISLAKATENPYYIIGNASNILISDKGYRGIIIMLRDQHAKVTITDEGETALVTAPSACPLVKVAMEAARAGLTGLEFAAGIPGSLGGAVFMNAGAYGGEIKDCIVSAEVMNGNGEVFTIDKEALDLSYRHSAVEEQGLVVLDATFRLKKGDTEAIMAVITDLNARRRDKQPLEYPSAGSTFKRPEGYFAGKLIQDAGLAGFAVGDACVSTKHCGFVINKGHATSTDIMQLINAVSDKVFETFGVRLEPEVRMLGF